MVEWKRQVKKRRPTRGVSLETFLILTVIFSCTVFIISLITIQYKITLESSEIDYLSEKLLLILTIVALILQALNLVLLGGIPLFNSELKANATNQYLENRLSIIFNRR